MKILFLARAYGEHAGGMERLSYELIRHVSQQPGVQMSLIAHKGSRRLSPLFNIRALPKALALARKADIIHLGDPVLSLLGWMLKKLTRKSIAVTVHGLDIVYPNPFYQLYLKLFFRNFDRYFPISRHVKNLLTTHYSLQPSWVSILTPGITDRFYDPSLTRTDLEKLLNQNLAGKKVLFTSGRLMKRKGHEWFIREVLPKLPKNVIYVIAGDGPEKDQISLLERKQAVLLGKVSENELKILYNTADAFIMPNIKIENDVEGFGLVLLEAALCNRPVFAANLEGIPDAIQNDKNGTLIEPQSSQAWIKTLTKFLKNPPANSNARDYTRARFSWASQSAVITKSLWQAARGQSA